MDDLLESERSMNKSKLKSATKKNMIGLTAKAEQPKSGTIDLDTVEDPMKGFVHETIKSKLEAQAKNQYIGKSLAKADSSPIDSKTKDLDPQKISSTEDPFSNPIDVKQFDPSYPRSSLMSERQELKQI